MNNEEDSSYCPSNFVDSDSSCGLRLGDWQKEPFCTGLTGLSRTGSNNYSTDAKKVRDNFKEYFNSTEGSIDWQLNKNTITVACLEMFLKNFCKIYTVNSRYLEHSGDQKKSSRYREFEITSSYSA